MQRRAFLGLLVAAVGFRLKAEPTADVTQIRGRVWVQGVDLAKGPDCTAVVVWSREDVARLFDVPVRYLDGAR